MKKTIYYLTILCLLAPLTIKAQIEADLLLQVQQATRDQRNALLIPPGNIVPGTLIYDITENNLYFFDGTNWALVITQNVSGLVFTG